MVSNTPLAVVVTNAFDADRTFSWPPKELTLHRWKVAAENPGARSALWTSIVTGIALNNAFRVSQSAAAAP